MRLETSTSWQSEEQISFRTSEEVSLPPTLDSSTEQLGSAVGAIDYVRGSGD